MFVTLDYNNMPTIHVYVLLSVCFLHMGDRCCDCLPIITVVCTISLYMVWCCSDHPTTLCFNRALNVGLCHPHVGTICLLCAIPSGQHLHHCLSLCYGGRYWSQGDHYTSCILTPLTHIMWCSYTNIHVILCRPSLGSSGISPRVYWGTFRLYQWRRKCSGWGGPAMATPLRGHIYSNDIHVPENNISTHWANS